MTATATPMMKLGSSPSLLHIVSGWQCILDHTQRHTVRDSHIHWHVIAHAHTIYCGVQLLGSLGLDLGGLDLFELIMTSQIRNLNSTSLKSVSTAFLSHVMAHFLSERMWQFGHELVCKLHVTFSSILNFPEILITPFKYTKISRILKTASKWHRHCV